MLQKLEIQMYILLIALEFRRDHLRDGMLGQPNSNGIFSHRLWIFASP